MRVPAPSYTPFHIADALGDVAVDWHASHYLARGGALQRAATLMDRGLPLEDAAWLAAKQGKGHLAELAQAANFNARAGAHRRDVLATISRSANDPRADLRVYRARNVRRHVQMKVGTPEYVKRALRAAPRHADLVANTESVHALCDDGFHSAFAIDDHVRLNEHRAEILVGEDTVGETVAALERELLEETASVIPRVAAAAAKDAATTFALTVSFELLEAGFCGRPVDLRRAISVAVGAAARGAVRTGLQTAWIANQFLRDAREAFSARLVRRVAQGTVVVGALAEVMVETAIDLIAVAQGQLSLDDLLKRIGVHCFTAAGGALGAVVALELARDAPWWAQLMLTAVGGWAGSRGGRALGQSLLGSAAVALPSPGTAVR